MDFLNRGDSLIVSLRGDVDFGNSNQVKEEIKHRITPEIRRLILDMGKVEFMDSSGAGILISLLKFMGQHGGTVALCQVQEEGAFVLRVTKLDAIFKVFKDREEALNAEI